MDPVSTVLRIIDAIFDAYGEIHLMDEAKDAVETYGPATVAKRLLEAIRLEMTAQVKLRDARCFEGMLLITDTFQRIPGMFAQFVEKGIYCAVAKFYW